MDKKNIELRPIKNCVFEFQGNEITMTPYISINVKNALIDNYVNTIFDENQSLSSRFLESEYGLILGIVDLCTDIEIGKLRVDAIINSGLWEAIKTRLNGYSDFRKELLDICSYKQNEINLNKSMGFTFDVLVTKVSDFIDKISSVDLSQEGVRELMKFLDKEKDQINAIVNPSLVK